MQKPILELGTLDLDMLGQLEFALERAPGDALMQIGRGSRGFALAGDSQDAVRDFDGEILFGEAGDSDGDAVIILVTAFDIVRRITLSGICRVEQVQQAIETDRGTEERGIVQTHDNNLLKALRFSGASSPRNAF